MNVNGLTGMGYTTGVSQKQKSSTKAKSEETSNRNEGVVYEKASRMTDVEREALVSKLEADSKERVSQMQSLVAKMFEKQGVTFAKADDMWKMLASGDFEADAETIAKAKEDISEDGYWGVSQTSDRIFDFAKALSGGDMEKMKEMQEAVAKGFSEATKTWGKDLPDISKQTLEAVNKKFEEFYNN